MARNQVKAPLSNRMSKSAMRIPVQILSIILQYDCSLPIAANKTIIRSDGKLYPNPVSDVATLIGISDIQSVTCYTLTGYKIDIPWREHTLDFSGVVPGIYFLKITGIDGSAAIIKVVKR